MMVKSSPETVETMKHIWAQLKLAFDDQKKTAPEDIVQEKDEMMMTNRFEHLLANTVYDVACGTKSQYVKSRINNEAQKSVIHKCFNQNLNVRLVSLEKESAFGSMQVIFTEPSVGKTLALSNKLQLWTSKSFRQHFLSRKDLGSEINAQHSAGNKQKRNELKRVKTRPWKSISTVLFGNEEAILKTNISNISNSNEKARREDVIAGDDIFMKEMDPFSKLEYFEKPLVMSIELRDLLFVENALIKYVQTAELIRVKDNRIRRRVRHRIFEDIVKAFGLWLVHSDSLHLCKPSKL